MAGLFSPKLVSPKYAALWAKAGGPGERQFPRSSRCARSNFLPSRYNGRNTSEIIVRDEVMNLILLIPHSKSAFRI
jgi:hypothetical protein